MPQMSDQDIDTFLGPAPSAPGAPAAPPTPASGDASAAPAATAPAAPSGPMSDDQINSFLGPISVPGQGTFLPQVSASMPSPEQKSFLSGTAVGRIMSAFGHGFEDTYNDSELFSPEVEAKIKQSGAAASIVEPQKTYWDAFKSGVLYPAAGQLDRQYKIAMAATMGVYSGAQNVVVQAGEELGFQTAARDLASIPDAFMGSPHMLEVAKDAHAIGAPQNVYMGVEEPKATPAAAPPVEAPVGAPAEPGEAAPAPAPSEPEATPAPPADVHAAARQIAPDVFAEYDPLAEHVATLRQQIQDGQTELQKQAEAQAPGSAEIADLEARMQDTTPRLAKKYQARLDALIPERDAFLANDDAMALLTRDTPDIAAMRQDLLAADYRMRDLSPQVSAAYAEAAKQFPVEEEAPAGAAEKISQNASPQAENTPAETPEEITPSAAAAQGQTAEPTAPVEPGQTPEGIAPTAQGQTPTPPAPIDIAADVSAKLQAAGRPAEEADAAAQVTKALWETRAARFEGRKGTAAEMYAREAPDIRAGKGARALELAQRGRTLEQRSPLLSDKAALEKQGQGALFDRSAKQAQEARDAEGNLKGQVPQKPMDEGLFSSEAKQRSLLQGTQGKIRLTADGHSVITLMKSANASTFIHEMGHDWLERTMRDAAEDEAPTSIKADAATIRKYLGVEEGQEISTSAHEKFARSFERYMMEGRAPSAALANVFAKFKNWLTTIYQSVKNLRAPITEDIRDVFDRMLAENPERQTAIVPETAREAEAREIVNAGPPEARPKSTDLYTKVKEPERLAAYVRRKGGVNDVGGDVRHILGGAKYRPGLINKAGRSLDDAALDAHEAGYFPEISMDSRPDINQFLDALAEDVRNENPRYSSFEQDKIDAFHEAERNNSEVDRLAEHYGITTDGMTREQFYNTLSEHLSIEQQAAEIQSMDDARQAEYDEAVAAAKEWLEEHDGEAWTSDDIFGIDGPRSEEELENAYRSQDAAGREGQSLPTGGDARYAGGREEPGEAGGRQGGRDSGNAGRPDAEAPAGTEPAGGGAGDRAAAGSEPGAGAPSLSPLDVKGEAPDFRTKEDREIERAANIRLDKINGSEDMNAALKSLAEQNGDFNDARYGSAAYRTQLDIRNTRVLLRAATSDMMAAAVKAAEGDPAAIADWLTKQKRAAMVFDHLSTLSADWAHAGHELNKTMEGWDQAKFLAQQIGETDEGRTLNQMEFLNKMRQKAAALVAKMQNAEQAGKFASDMEKTPWETFRERLIAYFVNNLISGPITHMAYAVGNETMMLYRMGPETAVAAAVGAMRGGADRVRAGEIGAQFYGHLAGARDGIFPAIEALKSGVAVLPGEAQGELAVGALSRPQVLPGKIGYALETPSRVVQGIHTLFYTMNYSAEIARLAYRQAAAKGLEGFAFDAEVARLKSAPPSDMMAAATDTALRAVLMKRPAEGSLQSKVASVVNDTHPLATVGKLAMPFMQIGMNILEEGLVERTPLSMLSGEARAELMGAKGGAAKDLRLAKIATGSMLGAAVFGMASQGLITGGDDPDPHKRAVAEDAGWKAYSIKVGDTYVPYRKYLGPLGPLVAVAADMHQIGAKLEDQSLTKVGASIAFAFSEVVADETWMAGLSGFVKAATNWDTDGERWLRSTATSFLPFSSLLNQTARLVDPYQRQARTMLDAVLNKTPLASEELQPQIGIWGQPIGSHMMVSPSTARTDPVDDRLMALDRGITPVEHKILGVPLTGEQYTDYARTAGLTAHMRLATLVQNPGFVSQPAEVQIKTIEKVITGSREQAAALMKMRYPSIFRQAMQNKAMLSAAR